MLNPTARFIWEGLQDGLDLEAIAAELAEGCKVPLEVTRRDAAAAVAHWQDQGLLGPPIPLPAPAAAETAGPGEDSRGETRYYRLLDKSFALNYADEATCRAIHPRFANLEAACDGEPEFALEIARHEAGSAGLSRFYDLTIAAHRGLTIGAWFHGAISSARSASVALVGTGGSGKSTLQAGLLAAGWAVFGDDRVFLEIGSMRPAAGPNSIGLKRGSWAVLADRFPRMGGWPIQRIAGRDVRFLPAPPPTSPFAPPLAAVVFPRFDASAETALTRLSATEALLRVIAAETWILPSDENVEGFLRWFRSIDFYNLPFSSLDRALALIQDLVA